ncbi:MAG: hypothetical protein MJE68_03770, partial [Proteobacteria bacterium]|nr:hypothetical protein [Pseudomonadota bacterium]
MGANTTSVLLATKDDSRLTPRGRDTFTIEILDNITDGYRLATTQATRLNITVLDDDVDLEITPPPDPNLLLNLFAGSNVDVNEGEAVNLTLRLTQPQPLPVVVSYATLTTANDTAKAGVDYVAVNTTTEIPANETEKTITITTLDNEIDVADNVTLRFSVIANASINGENRTTSSTVIIIDDDRHPELTIAADKTQARRGDNLTFTITSPFNAVADIAVALTLTGSLTEYTLGGTTTAITTTPTPSNIQVPLPMGENMVTFTAKIADRPDYSRNITARLETGAGYGVSADATSREAQVEVLRPIPPVVGIYIVDAAGNEGSMAEFEEGHSSFSLIIRTANGTVLADRNLIQWEVTQPTSPVISAIDDPRAYNDIGRTAGVGSTTSNNTVNTTITGVVGPQAGNVGIMLNASLADNRVDDEVMRELVWRLLPATSVVNNYTIASAAGEVRVRLYDNDPAVTLGSAGSGDVVFVNEGDSLHIPLRAETGSIAGGATTHPHQIIIQATDPLDLIDGAAGRITVPLATGASEAILTLQTNENTVLDAGNRNFTLEIDDVLADGYRLGSRHRQTIVVRDDDAVLSLTPTTSTVNEGETVDLMLTLNQAQPEAFAVSYATVAGTAQAGTDYTAVNASVTFLAGETEKTLTVQTLNNTIDVLADVSFSVVANMSLYGVKQTRTALVAVVDDDNSFNLTLTPRNVSVVEGSPAQFTLTLSNPLGGTTPFVVSYATNDGTARAGVNYAGVQNGIVEFQPGETSKTITVNTLADAVHSHATPLLFTLTVNATRDGTEFRRMAGVNVTEGGTPPALTLALSDTSVDEGDAFVLSADVSRQSAQPLPVTLNITTPPGFSVTDGAMNYGGSVVQQVEFPARTTSHEFARFRLVEDTVNADDGVFSVRAIQTIGDTSFVLATPN